MDSYEETICQVVYVLRKFSKMKQKEMASKIGVSLPTYWRIENGLTVLTFSNFRRICAVLGFSQTYIMGLIEIVWAANLEGGEVSIEVLIFKELNLKEGLS